MSRLDIVVLSILLSWIAGFSLRIGGDRIHLLLAIALVLLIFRLAPAKR